MTFWRPSFFNIGYSVALTGVGLIFISAPASPASTAGGGDSPSYSGFFHCLAVSDDQSSPCFSPNSCVLQNVRNASPRVFYPVLIFGSSRAHCILSYMTIRFANKLILKSILCSIVFSTRLNPFFPRLIACRSISWIPLFIYLSILRLLPVACCQLGYSTMDILSTPYLSRQHITAYLY